MDHNGRHAALQTSTQWVRCMAWPNVFACACIYLYIYTNAELYIPFVLLMYMFVLLMCCFLYVLLLLLRSALLPSELTLTGIGE
jgi:hypothetical protein